MTARVQHPAMARSASQHPKAGPAGSCEQALGVSELKKKLGRTVGNPALHTILSGLLLYFSQREAQAAEPPRPPQGWGVPQDTLPQPTRFQLLRAKFMGTGRGPLKKNREVGRLIAKDKSAPGRSTVAATIHKLLEKTKEGTSSPGRSREPSSDQKARKGPPGGKSTVKNILRVLLAATERGESRQPPEGPPTAPGRLGTKSGGRGSSVLARLREKFEQSGCLNTGTPRQKPGPRMEVHRPENRLLRTSTLASSCFRSPPAHFLACVAEPALAVSVATTVARSAGSWLCPGPRRSPSDPRQALTGQGGTAPLSGQEPRGAWSEECPLAGEYSLASVLPELAPGNACASMDSVSPTEGPQPVPEPVSVPASLLEGALLVQVSAAGPQAGSGEHTAAPWAGPQRVPGAAKKEMDRDAEGTGQDKSTLIRPLSLQHAQATCHTEPALKALQVTLRHPVVYEMPVPPGMLQEVPYKGDTQPHGWGTERRPGAAGAPRTPRTPATVPSEPSAPTVAPVGPSTPAGAHEEPSIPVGSGTSARAPIGPRAPEETSARPSTPEGPRTPVGLSTPLKPSTSAEPSTSARAPMGLSTPAAVPFECSAPAGEPMGPSTPAGLRTSAELSTFARIPVGPRIPAAVPSESSVPAGSPMEPTIPAGLSTPVRSSTSAAAPSESHVPARAPVESSTPAEAPGKPTTPMEPSTPVRSSAPVGSSTPATAPSESSVPAGAPGKPISPVGPSTPIGSGAPVGSSIPATTPSESSVPAMRSNTLAREASGKNTSAGIPRGHSLPAGTPGGHSTSGKTPERHGTPGGSPGGHDTLGGTPGGYGTPEETLGGHGTPVGKPRGHGTPEGTLGGNSSGTPRGHDTPRGTPREHSTPEGTLGGHDTPGGIPGEHGTPGGKLGGHSTSGGTPGGHDAPEGTLEGHITPWGMPGGHSTFGGIPGGHGTPGRTPGEHSTWGRHSTMSETPSPPVGSVGLSTAGPRLTQQWGADGVLRSEDSVPQLGAAPSRPCRKLSQADLVGPQASRSTQRFLPGFQVLPMARTGVGTPPEHSVMPKQGVAHCNPHEDGPCPGEQVPVARNTQNHSSGNQPNKAGEQGVREGGQHSQVLQEQTLAPNHSCRPPAPREPSQPGRHPGQRRASAPRAPSLPLPPEEAVDTWARPEEPKAPLSGEQAASPKVVTLQHPHTQCCSPPANAQAQLPVGFTEAPHQLPPGCSVAEEPWTDRVARKAGDCRGTQLLAPSTWTAAPLEAGIMEKPRESECQPELSGLRGLGTEVQSSNLNAGLPAVQAPGSIQAPTWEDNVHAGAQVNRTAPRDMAAAPTADERLRELQMPAFQGCPGIPPSAGEGWPKSPTFQYPVTTSKGGSQTHPLPDLQDPSSASGTRRDTKEQGQWTRPVALAKYRAQSFRDQGAFERSFKPMGIRASDTFQPPK